MGDRAVVGQAWPAAARLSESHSETPPVKNAPAAARMTKKRLTQAEKLFDLSGQIKVRAGAGQTQTAADDQSGGQHMALAKRRIDDGI